MTSLLHLDFDNARITGHRVMVKNRGRVPVKVRLVTSGGATAVIAADDGGRHALRLPPFSDGSRPQGAVLLVHPDADAGDEAGQLDPAGHDFVFGATFALDQRSEGDRLDNGNNLVQRGLSADPSQYKLQVDHGHASCRVAGDQGVLKVTSRTVVKPKEWYAVTCSRVGRTLDLTLRRGSGARERVSVTGAVGSVTAPAGTPLTIGGKTFDGHVVTDNSDQFNGQVAEVFLSVGSHG